MTNPFSSQPSEPDPAATRTCEVTLAIPGGRQRVAVPIDIPIGLLLADFVTLADSTSEQESDGWELSLPGHDTLPSTATLADCGLQDGGELQLRQNARRKVDSSKHSEERRRADAGVDRPISARTARALPARPSRPQRIRAAATALWTANPTNIVSRSPHTPVTPDPRRFTAQTRNSPLRRVRDTWRETDYERRMDQAIIEPRLRRCVIIAVVSPKGGVGKSTVSALLGALLAYLRRDRTVGVDTNPDWGSLGRRLVSDHPVFIDDLLNGPLQLGELSVTHLDAQLGRGPDGLMIAPAPTAPQRSEQLDEAAYRTLFQRLGELVGTLVLDCGTGLNEPPARACADQLVLVADSEPDTASLVAEAGVWLEHSGPPLTLLVNKIDRSSRLHIGELERAMPHARGMAVLPTNQRGAAQLLHSQFSWTAAPRAWRIAIRELATLLASDWRRLGVALEPSQLP